jgi:hypothetical protein
MSLIIAAPPSIAARITATRRVSTEIGTGKLRNRARTGVMRASSSASETGAAPGRVDSPPMSMMSDVDHAHDAWNSE